MIIGVWFWVYGFGRMVLGVLFWAYSFKRMVLGVWFWAYGFAGARKLLGVLSAKQGRVKHESIPLMK